jgi:FkbM family methyltransferase
MREYFNSSAEYIIKTSRKVIFFLGLGKPFSVASKRFLDAYYNENESDMRINGEADFLARNKNALRVVFDVGANVGEWTKHVLALNPHAEVHCFEPGDLAFRELRAAHFPQNVHLNNVAVGSKCETRTLHVFDNNTGTAHSAREVNTSLYGRTLVTRTNPGKETLRSVSVDTIDHYCHAHRIPNIDLVKIDVEAGEVDVLRGAAEMLRAGKISMIYFEYNDCWIDARIFLKDVFELIEPYHCRVYAMYPNKLRAVPKYDYRLDNFKYRNYVIAKSDFLPR